MHTVLELATSRAEWQARAQRLFTTLANACRSTILAISGGSVPVTMCCKRLMLNTIHMMQRKPMVPVVAESPIG
jgi:hypothetical protein